jgi:hypothetical protein
VSGGTVSERESAIARLLGIALHTPSNPKSKPGSRRPPPQPRPPPPPETKPPPVTVIADAHMRVILLMDETINSATPAEELIANPRLRLHLRYGADIKGPFVGQGSVLQLAPAPIVSFLVEGFAASQDPAIAHRFKKFFPDGRPPIPLRLPIQLPVTFATNGENVVLGYFDTARISAVETKNHVAEILNNLWSIPVLLASVKGVDPKLFVPQLLTFADAAKLVVMYDIERENKAQGNAELTVRVLKSHWDDTRDDQVQREFRRIFDDSAVLLCRTCRQLFAKADGSDCTPPGPHVAGRPGRQPPSITFGVATVLDK